MKLILNKIKLSGVAISLFVVIMLLLSLYFFIRLSKNQQYLEQRGFRTLTQLAVAMKEKDAVVNKVVQNSTSAKANIRLGESSIKKHLYLSSITDNQGNVSIDSVKYAYTAGKYFAMSIKDFINPLLTRRDFFSQYVVLRSDTILFSTLGGDAHLSKEKFKIAGIQKSLLSSSSLTEKSTEDSVLLIQAGFTQNVKIQGKPYIFFAVPLKLNAKPDWYLGGLIEENIFLAWKRSLPFEILIYTILVLFFVIFSFPVLKVFLSGPLEKNTRLGYTLTGVSLVAIPVLLLILMSEVLLSHRLKQDNFKQLKLLNEKVISEFTAESELILNQLHDYQTAGFDPIKDPVPSVLDLELDQFKPFKYPFFKAFFPADDAGDQPLYLTTYSAGEKSNVSNRDYFLNPEKYKSIIWYNMEPIYSNTSGEWIIAFSTPSGKPETSRILAITSSMYSLKDPVLPDGFKYCLVEKSGRIWYDSEEIYNLSDNLLTETNNNHKLAFALKSNSASKFKVSIRNQKHLIYVSPVPDTELFVVTLLNPARTNAMEALTTSTVIGFFAVLYLVLLVLIVLIKMATFKKTSLAHHKYFFSWLTPKRSKIFVYKTLLVVNVAGVVFFLILSVSGVFGWFSVGGITLFFLLMIAGHFMLMYYFLNVNDFKKQNVDYDQRGCIKVYTHFIFSWLVFGSILPALVLMGRFTAAESKIYAQNQLCDLAQNINKRTLVLRDFFEENYNKNSCKILFEKRNSKGLYFEAMNFKSRDLQQSLKADNTLDLIHQTYFSLIRMDFYKMMGETKLPVFGQDVRCYEVKNDPSSVAITFRKIADPFIETKATNNDTLVAHHSRIKLYSPITQTVGWSWGVITFWIIALLLMFLIYYLLKKMLFILFPYQELNFKKSDPEKLLNVVMENKISVVVISIQSPDKKYFMRKGFCYIDLAEKSPQNIPDEKCILILNFEKGIKNPAHIAEKLQLLEAYINHPPVVLMLTKTPVQLLNYFNELWKNEPYPMIFKSHLRWFESLVAALPVFCIMPFQEPKTNEASFHTQPDTPAPCKTIETMLRDEAMINPDIIKMMPFLALEFESSWSKGFCDDKSCSCNIDLACSKETFVLKVQEYSRPRYQAIWDSLTKNEQFVLNDLAEDSIVNMKNRDIIKSLISKGILKLNDTLEIVSQPFRNFILTDVDKTQLDALQKTIQLTGNWNRLRTPIIFMAVSIGIFLFVTQQNFLSTLNTYLLSIVTIAGTFLKFSGMFSKSKAE